MRLRFNIHKLTLPMLFVSMMLQRSPVIRLIAQSNISLIPRVQHVWTALVAAVTVGAYNSVTAASGQIEIAPGSTSTTVQVGELLQVVIWVGGEKAGDPFPPEIWEFTGNLPAGVTSLENKSAGTLSFSGTPTEAGVFPITVRAWEKLNKNEGSNDSFDLTITVEGIVTGPVFTQDLPANPTVAWGNALSLTASVDQPAGTTFQWQRLLPAGVDYTDIVGQTTNTLNLTDVTSSDDGPYRVIATNGGNATTSTTANVAVTTTPFQSWRELNFNDPLSVDASMDQDPDKDSLINLIEFTFGLDPLAAESKPLVNISTEAMGSIRYLVYTYPPIVPTGDSQVTMEANDSLLPAEWNLLTDGAEGVQISSDSQAYVVRVPIKSSLFNRLKIVSN